MRSFTAPLGICRLAVLSIFPIDLAQSGCALARPVRHMLLLLLLLPGTTTLVSAPALPDSVRGPLARSCPMPHGPGPHAKIPLNPELRRAPNQPGAAERWVGSRLDLLSILLGLGGPPVRRVVAACLSLNRDRVEQAYNACPSASSAILPSYSPLIVGLSKQSLVALPSCLWRSSFVRSGLLPTVLSLASCFLALS